MEITMREIGKVRAGKGFSVELDAEYAAGLIGLKGFSHVVVVWYADRAPGWKADDLVIAKPYRLAPERLGAFATRTPHRPNGICLSVAAVSSIDEKKGIVKLWWIDAEDGTPVLDVKPYHPSSDLVRNAKRPDWCAHWPESYDESGDFDWGREFLF